MIKIIAIIKGNKMGKVRITESMLQKLIEKNIRNVLNEGLLDKNKPITLPELLRNLDYRGNLGAIVKNAGSQVQTPEQWANVLSSISQKYGINNPSLSKVYSDLANNIRQSVEDRGAVASGIKNLTADGNADVKVGTTGRYTITGNPYSKIMQYAGGLASTNPGGSYTLRTFLQNAQHSGELQGMTEQSIRKTVTDKIRFSGNTLKANNPEEYNTYAILLDNWLNHNHGPKIQDLSKALAAFGQILNTSRNDMPVVAGFQRVLNFFQMKTAEGKPYGVDGIIGKDTRGALAQLGYKDIFQYKADIEAFQEAAGIKKDGKAQNETITALQNNNIKSFPELKRFIRNHAFAQKGLTNPPSQGIKMPAPTVVSNTPSGGLMEKRIRVTENDLRQIIRESVEEIVKEDNRYNYAMDWENLSEPEKQAFAKRYQWSPFHKNGYTGSNDLDAAEKVYKRKQAWKGKRGNLSYSSNQYNQMSDKYHASNASTQAASMGFQKIENALSDIQAEGKRTRKNILENNAVSYTETATTDAQGNTQTDRVYNDQNNFSERTATILTKLGKLKQAGQELAKIRQALKSNGNIEADVKKINNLLIRSNKLANYERQQQQTAAANQQTQTGATQKQAPTGQNGLVTTQA